MRSLSSIVCAVLIVSLFVVSPVVAKGGRGGGGGSNRGGRGGLQSGPKASGQQARGSGNKQTQPGGQSATDKHSDKVVSKPDKKTTTADPGKATEGADGTEAVNKKQKQLETAQRQRDKRLAQADHLRTIAERNGNQNLADAADRMADHAEELYQQRLEQLSRFGVTDPSLDPGGVTDPVGDIGPELLPAIP